MGWKEGEGIGGPGRAPAAAPAAGAPPPPGGGGGGGGLGLGAAPHGAVEEGDDEFTRYRKRSEPARGGRLPRGGPHARRQGQEVM
jgi:hypothetical protein